MRYIGTISIEDWPIRAVKQTFNSLDTHELYIGREIGKGGFKHYQYCVDCAGDLEQYNRDNNLGWHVEQCVSWSKSVDYCRKEDNYVYIGNSIEEREYQRIKHRRLRPVQSAIVDSIRNQNDRSITVWIDRQGSAGKSTLLYLMERRGKWCAIPRTEQTANRINDYVAINYDNEECIVIDMGRSRKLTTAQTEVLEDVKDGLIKSTKYEGHKKLIKGVKVLVFTNNWIPEPVYKSLTEDRWDIHVLPSTSDEGTTNSR